LAACNFGTITNCYVTGIVEGAYGLDNGVGGLVGRNYGTIKGCYSAVEVNETEYCSYAGGLVGLNKQGGIVSNSYATGKVNSGVNVGGLIGGNTEDGNVSFCYSTGQVSGDSNVGGLVGDSNAVTTASFWDVNTSGRTTSAGGEGKTTAQMQDVNTFLNAGWDFVGESINGTEDIWEMEGINYPKLEWQ
jgi:hypothetical protein